MINNRLNKLVAKSRLLLIVYIRQVNFIFSKYIDVFFYHFIFSDSAVKILLRLIPVVSLKGNSFILIADSN